MPRLDFRYLDPVLVPRHATPVDDPAERARLLDEIDEADTSAEPVYGLISRQGRVLSWQLPNGERLIYEGEIQLNQDGALVDGWEPVGDPRIYRVNSDDDVEMAADVERLFLAHSLRTGAAIRFTGWRERVVALIPEEVGPKESKIIRTTRDGDIEATHTYNVLDAISMYATWVNELAMEFGGTDEILIAGTAWSPATNEEGQVRHIIQAWLMREAADAQLSQARGSLKLGLGGHARILKHMDRPHLSIAELARSLYTDRPNLSKIISAAERDSYLTRLFDAIESDDSNALLAVYRER